MLFKHQINRGKLVSEYKQKYIIHKRRKVKKLLDIHNDIKNGEHRMITCAIAIKIKALILRKKMHISTA